MTGQEFTYRQTLLLQDIPEEFKGGIAYLAYERGHTCGNEEILKDLVDILDSLSEPIKNFEKRIRMEENAFSQQ